MLKRENIEEDVEPPLSGYPCVPLSELIDVVFRKAPLYCA